MLINRPDVSCFWTAFDPLDLASDSIDPLGFTAGYIALADRILPGFTTVTTVPRYASMLCAALKEAEKSGVGLDANPVERRRQIIERLKQYERTWALACGLAEQEVGEKATAGLRGIRKVRQYLELHSKAERISAEDLVLLSNQVRYGGIGAYSAFLEALHLADMVTLRLRSSGEELAERFPSPESYGLDNILRNGARLPVKNLRQWGMEAHVGQLGTEEARLLSRALQGGEEATDKDAVRWTMLRLVRKCDESPSDTEEQVLQSCLEGIDLVASKVTSPLPQIQATLRIIKQYERIFQCVSFVFERLRAHATATGRTSLKAALIQPELAETTTALKSACKEFESNLAGAENAGVAGTLRQELAKFSLIEFAAELASLSATPLEIGGAILRRHLRVQDGKFEGGLPKGPWIRLETQTSNIVCLTSQRFGVEGQWSDSWSSMARHPYRIGGARRFIRLCRIPRL